MKINTIFYFSFFFFLSLYEKQTILKIQIQINDYKEIWEWIISIRRFKYKNVLSSLNFFYVNTIRKF